MLTVPVVVAYTAEMMLYHSGPINDVITRLSGTDFKPSWLSNPNIALMTVSLLEIWNWTPFSFIIMLAGLSASRRSRSRRQKFTAPPNGGFLGSRTSFAGPVILLALVLRFLEAMAEFPKRGPCSKAGPVQRPKRSLSTYS